jgi:hypothetical protein
MERVENIRVNGMFDVNFCSQGTECWIEIKDHEEPVRPTTPLFGSGHKVSQDQKNWALSQTKAGGRCYFLIITNKRIMLLAGTIEDRINSLTVLELKQAAIWWRLWPVVEKDWQDLRNILIK